MSPLESMREPLVSVFVRNAKLYFSLNTSMLIEGKLSSIRLANFENLSGILILSTLYSVFRISIFLSARVFPASLSSAGVV